jgi:hypothetical protein
VVVNGLPIPSICIHTHWKVPDDFSEVAENKEKHDELDG